MASHCPAARALLVALALVAVAAQPSGPPGAAPGEDPEVVSAKIDIDQELVEICKIYLQAWHQNAFDNVRSEILFSCIEIESKHLGIDSVLFLSRTTFRASILNFKPVMIFFV